MSEQFYERQPVKHIKKKLHEAKFAGYTKSGLVKVTHNELHPFGVSWRTDTFKAENIVSGLK